MVENGGNFRAIFIEEPAERRSVNLTTIAEYEQKQAKSHNHKWVNLALTWMAHKKRKPDVDVVCVEPLGNSSQNPVRESVETQTSPWFTFTVSHGDLSLFQ